MSTFLLDTTILIGLVKASPYADFAEKKFQLFMRPNVTVISIVSAGELRAFALRRNWGLEKMGKLKHVLSRIPPIYIRPQIVDMYVEIDAYSQGKHPQKSLPTGMSARNMGDNDLWIAATATAINATLVTADHDFDHLDNVFLPVGWIDQSSKPGDIP